MTSISVVLSAVLLASPAATPQAGAQAPGPLEQRAQPITADNPMPKRTDYQAAEYPAEARGSAAAGRVTLRVTVDESGRVAEVRRLGFSISSASPKVSASFHNLPDVEVQQALARTYTADDARLIVSTADALFKSAATAVSRWRYEPPVSGPVTFDVSVSFKEDGETTAATSLAFRSAWPTADGAVRVGGDVKEPRKVRDVRPVYPPEAQAAGVSGMVILEARIGEDGAVERAKVLRSIPLLDQAAIDSVTQWRFTPTLLNGKAVPVLMTVTVNFTLSRIPQ